MTTYTTPDGYSVTRETDGSVILTHGDTEYRLVRTDTDALRDFFLHELGLWRDPETGLIVVTKPSAKGFRLVVDADSPGRTAWRAGGGVVDDARGQAVARYLATVAPPPREPQEGEVWRITDSTGSEHNVVVSGTVFEDGDGGWYISIIPADRRRLLVEADGTVVAGDE